MSQRFLNAVRKIIEFVVAYLRKNPKAARPFMTPTFARQLKEVESGDTMLVKNFCKVLAADPSKPKRGRNVDGTHCHKTDMAKGNRSAMYRILYYHSVVRNEVYFILLFAKADQENLTSDQAREINRTIERIDAGEIELTPLFSGSGE
jgi:hypothetical protein